VLHYDGFVETIDLQCVINIFNEKKQSMFRDGNMLFRETQAQRCVFMVQANCGTTSELNMMAVRLIFQLEGVSFHNMFHFSGASLLTSNLMPRGDIYFYQMINGAVVSYTPEFFIRDYKMITRLPRSYHYWERSIWPIDLLAKSSEMADNLARHISTLLNRIDSDSAMLHQLINMLHACDVDSDRHRSHQRTPEGKKVVMKFFVKLNLLQLFITIKWRKFCQCTVPVHVPSLDLNDYDFVPPQNV